jgi:hypothetical protein
MGNKLTLRLNNQYQDKLSHLTDNAVEDLIQRYYNGEKNKILIEEYNIDISNLSFLVKTFPPKKYFDKICPFCNISMISYRQSKSASSKETIFCQNCQHELDNSFCSCSSCMAKRLKEKEVLFDVQRQVIIDENLIKEEYKLDIKELDIQMKLYLSALLRASLSEDLEDINPLSTSALILTPITLNNKYETKIITFLKENGLIIFSPNTRLNSVTIENNEIIRYFPLDVTYRLNIANDELDIEIDELLYLEDSIEKDEKLLLRLWLEIGLYECLEYLYSRLDEYSLPSQYIGKKTILSIESALNNFSISQVFYFIWNASKNAAAFYQKDNVTKKHAVNLVAGNISRNMERAIAENWHVSKYGRAFTCPQSIVSEVFFNRVLKIGDSGFDMVARNYFENNEEE